MSNAKFSGLSKIERSSAGGSKRSKPYNSNSLDSFRHVQLCEM